MTTLWIRAETKPFESRAPLWPSDARQLVEAGHDVVVERSEARCVPEQDYRHAGCRIAAAGGWRAAPAEAVILGLKALPAESAPLEHRHVFFGHAYNASRIFTEKPGAVSLLSRFIDGRGAHYDLEFLVDERSRRVATFGASAGLAGAAIALLVWLQKQAGASRPHRLPMSYRSSDEFIQSNLKSIRALGAVAILVVGAAGRCGRGVVELLSRCGLRYEPWGRAETLDPEAYRKILRHDILFNCIQAREATPPLLTRDQLTANERLTLIADVGCETSGNNPLPIYRGTTSYDDPTRRVDGSSPPMDVIAIDNLPAFFPHESSRRFSSQLLPHLADFLSRGNCGVWQRAHEIFLLSLSRLRYSSDERTVTSVG